MNSLIEGVKWFDVFLPVAAQLFCYVVVYLFVFGGR